MRIPGRVIVVAATAALLVFGGTTAILAATAPEVDAVTIGMDTATNRAVLTIVGKSLTKFTGFALTDSQSQPVPGTVDILVRGKAMLVLGLPPGIAGGEYDLTPALKTGPGQVLHLRVDDGALFQGTLGSGTIPGTGAGVRMMWYPGKAAFRVGRVSGTQWDDASVGSVSVAMGEDTTASGQASTASGYLSLAGGNYSTAMGYSTTAGGTYSTAMGQATTASGYISTAMGFSTNASSDSSTAMGYQTTAGGNYSTAMGYQTTASAGSSTAMGNSTTASGDHTTAMGFFTNARAYGSLVLGRYNVNTGTPDAWITGEPVLVVGNGSSSGSRSNALTLLKDGTLNIAGPFTQNSDERLKKEVTPLAGVLRKLAAIRGISYRMKDEAKGPAGIQIGLLAQEVRAVFPELVHEDSQGTLSVAYGNFSAVLLEAVKEQQAALDARDREVAALKKELAEEIAATEARLSCLEALLSGNPSPTRGK